MKKTGGLWLCVLTFAACLGFRCAEDQRPKGDVPQLTISPDSVTIEISSAERFAATLDGEEQYVGWYVNGVRGGDPWRGMISWMGYYVAPDSSRKPTWSVLRIGQGGF